MPRTIAALYDSRLEAEFARSRLVSRLKARSPRIIGKDTAGAVDGLDISPAAAEDYREGIANGAHLLVAEVPSGSKPERVIELLEEAMGHGADRAAARTWGDSDRGVQVEVRDEPSIRDAGTEPDSPAPAFFKDERAAASPPRRGPPPAIAVEAPVEAPRLSANEEQLRVGNPAVARGGARVRSITREVPAEEQVSLDQEQIIVETRPSGRQLTEAEIEAGGLFKERVFEVAEMREEPVVTKIAVVRDEIIVRKTVNQRTETVRDTVSRTDVEVEDLAVR